MPSVTAHIEFSAAFMGAPGCYFVSRDNKVAYICGPKTKPDRV